MEGAVLKSNIVNPGKSCPVGYSVDEIAQANVDVFKRCMPVRTGCQLPIILTQRWTS